MVNGSWFVEAEMTVLNLDQLEVWVRAKDFAVAVYKDVIPHLPGDEKWNLAQQLKRAAQSIPANIAEGHGRYHFLDNVRFCYIARDSLTEVQSHPALAHDLGFLPDLTFNSMTSDAESIGRQLNTYIAFLKRSKHSEKEFPAGYALRESPGFYDLETHEEVPTH
jgi:four helix bundle protein